jgi:cytochrome c oxidase subunit 4
MDERARSEDAALHDHPDIDRHVRAALLVFGALLVLTGFTVAAWTLHLPTRSAIALALLIATVKGSLVAGWFMHLITEKRIIYWVLALTAAFFVPLVLIPVLTSSSAFRP